jgi:uroporphyrinogen decarboxylase
MTSRERVQAAFAHAPPDWVPCDYFGTPEIRQALESHFGVKGDDALRDCLGTDVRYIRLPPYQGPPLTHYEDGSSVDIWGVRRRPVPNEYGEYDEPVELPYADWTTVEEVEAFPWPDPDMFDYDELPGLVAAYGDCAVGIGSFGVQDFINGVAFGRGVEQVLVDIATEDPVYLAMVEKRHRFYMALIERMLDVCRGRVDLVLCGDDFGSQRGALIAPQTFDRLFAEKKRELFDLVHAYGAKVTHHCCGSSRELIPHFIETGMDGLQTIQPQAEGMNPYGLKRDFGERLVLHGAVDVQGWLQQAVPDEIEREVNRLMEEVGAGGGYLLGPCHNIQPDTPPENALAVYRAVARRRGERLAGE